jgi:hypothetical protein
MGERHHGNPQKLHIGTDKDMLAMLLRQRRVLSRLKMPRSLEHLLIEQSFCRAIMFRGM